MDRVIKGISSKAAQYHNKGVAAAVSCAALLALSFVPFCKWAYAASIAAGLASASYFSNECSLNECKKDVLKIQSGYKDILDDYIKSKRNAENALKVLNKCLYGSETCSGGEITYSDFNSSIKYMMSDYNYKISEKDFKECIGDAECSDITEVISRIYLAMKSKKDSGFVQLEAKIKEDRENYENWDEIKYQKELYKLYADTMIKNVPVNYMNGTESYIAEGFACLNGCYENILSENVNNLMDQKIFECSLIMQDFENQVADWKNQMNLVVESADYEWQKAEEKLLTEFNLWNRNFNREYEICRQEWNDEYESFLEEKNEWIETQYIKAALSGTDEENKDDVDERVKKYLEIDRRSSSSFANNIDAQKYIDLIYDNSLFENLNGYSCQLNEIAKNYNAAKFNRTDFELNESMRDSLVNSALEKIENDMKDYASLYSLQIARDEIDSAVQDIFDRVEQSNKQMEKWELDLVRKDGYTVSNEIWRNAIIDSTVTENAIREKQTVHRYEYFKCSYPVLSYLLDCSFGYDSNDDVTLMMQKSFDEINSWKSGIFGDETQKGQFEVHVGKAPVFVSRVDTSKNYFENISEIGSGQLGFIMLDFMWNSYKNRDGYAALATPLYDKKITRDNTFLGIELPTIRQVTQTVCDIAASATGNALFGFIDEAFYGALDLDFGTKDIDEVTKSFGKAAVNMGVGSAAGKLTASLEGCSNIALRNLGTAAVKTASNYSTSVLNSYIDAMSFENGFSIDFDRANRVWSDGNVLKSAASAGASYLTKVSSATVMRDLDLYDAVGKKLEWKVFNTEGLAALNDVVSTVAASSVEKAITGRTSLSLLNTSDLGFDLKGGDIGLLSVNFDENGTAFKFDESGMQLGVKKSLSAAGALRDFVKITDAKLKSCLNDDRAATVLNAVNGLCKTDVTGNYVTAKDIWDGKKKVKFFEGDELGKYKDGVIYINKKFVSNDVESAAQVASLMEHENQHSHGSDEFVARRQGYETYIALSELYGVDDDKYAGMSDIAGYSEILKNYGEEMLFNVLFWSDAYNHSDDGFEYYMVNTKVANIHQNEDEMKAYILGEGWEKDVVDAWNKKKYQEEYDRYVNDEFKKYIGEKYRDYVEHATGTVCKSVEEFGESFEINEFKKLNTLKYKDVDSFNESIKTDKTLSKYKFEEETFDTIASHGCVLTTAVYIVYSIDNVLVSLQEANKICKDNNLFSGEEGRQKQYLSSGDGFMNAVNAIAGKELLIGYVSAKNEKKGQDNPINKVYNECLNSDKGYIGVARVLDNVHATMLKSEQNDYVYDEENEMRLYDSFGVANPWLSETSKWGRSNYDMKDVSNIYMYEVNPIYCNVENEK